METRQLSRFTRHFFSGTLLSRMTGLGREVIMAVCFGATPLVAAFWMAFRFSHLLRRILGEGALNCAFVPHFEKIYLESPSKASRFFFDLYIFLGGAVLLLILFAEGGLYLFSCRGEISLSSLSVIKMTMSLLPCTLFITLFALNQSYLNCLNCFFLPSVAPALMNLVWMLGVGFLVSFPQSQALFLLTHFVVLAFILQWALTVPAILKTFYRHQIFQLPRYSLKELRALLSPFLLAMIGVTAVQINTALDTLFARVADPAGPAYLWYAIRLQQLPLALFGVAIASTTFPTLSKVLSNGDEERFHFLMNFAAVRTISLLLPITCGLFVAAPTLVKLVYAYGAFDKIALDQTAAALTAYGTSLVPMTLVMLLASVCYAKGDYRFPALTSIALVLLNIFLNSLFVYGYGWGAISVAFATSICSFVNLVVLFLRVEKIKTVNWEGTLNALWKSSLCSAAGMIGVLCTPDMGSRIVELILVGCAFSLPFLAVAQLVDAPIFSIKKALFPVRNRA